jgi:c-di-GMP-binding flagellar brake protein YcgR
MSTVRKVHLAPTFKPVDSEKECKVLYDEIRKLRPPCEISLEGLNEIAKGKILDWQPHRKLFSVEWSKKSEAFDLLTEKSVGLRAYVKTQLFTTQLVFKSTTIRRVDETHSHFRLPEILYHQQQRGALRVPLINSRGTLKTPRGEFIMKDLSVGGAKIEVPNGSRLSMGIELSPCELRIGTLRITNPEFKVKVARTIEGVAGVRFVGLAERHRSVLRQFLINALKEYYEQL